MQITLEHYDEVEGYCPRLGHHLNFKYCRTENGLLPCRKIRDCWFAKLEIESYLETFLKPEDLVGLEQAPKPKMLSIYEIMLKAQEQKKAQED